MTLNLESLEGKLLLSILAETIREKGVSAVQHLFIMDEKREKFPFLERRKLDVGFDEFHQLLILALKDPGSKRDENISPEEDEISDRLGG